MVDGQLEITFIRTSCLLIEYGGKRILTDPWFGPGMRGLPVFRKPGIPLDEVPPLDYIVATHLHPDHFDRRSVQRLAHPKLEIVGTVGTADYCRSIPGVHVTDMLPWQRHKMGPFELLATPAEHTGPPPPEVNFVMELGPWRVFFGGDVRWSDAFRQVADRVGPIDIALLPIGGTLIFGHRTTMNPSDAVRACNLLRPRWAIPIHEGGEWLPVPPASWHPGRNRHFVRALRQSGLPVEPCVLKPGQTGLFSGEHVRKRTFRKVS
jgi:L-ascorbate metabolism protein UlaG (beta-lactamase superfamily)